MTTPTTSKITARPPKPAPSPAARATELLGEEPVLTYPGAPIAAHVDEESGFSTPNTAVQLRRTFVAAKKATRGSVNTLLQKSVPSHLPLFGGSWIISSIGWGCSASIENIRVPGNI